MALKRRRSILASLLIAGILLSGCSAEKPRPGTLSVGDAFSYGSADDGRRFYSTTLRVTAGDITLTGIEWSEADSSIPAPTINLRPDAQTPVSDSRAYGLPDSTDSIPWKISAPDGGASYVSLTLIFSQATETPTGALVLTYTSGDEERDLEVTPSWSGNRGESSDETVQEPPSRA